MATATAPVSPSTSREIGLQCGGKMNQDDEDANVDNVRVVAR